MLKLLSLVTIVSMLSISFHYSPANAEQTILSPTLQDISDAYKIGGSTAAKISLKKKGITIKPGDTITIIIALSPFPMEVGWSLHYDMAYDRRKLSSLGASNLHSTGNRFMADIPIENIIKLLKLSGVMSVHLPDQNLFAQIENNEKYEQNNLANMGCFEVSRYVIEQKKLKYYGPCVETEYDSTDNRKIYYVDITTYNGPEGSEHYRAVVDDGNVTDFLDMETLKYMVSPSSNLICDWFQPYTLSLVSVGNQYYWKVYFDDVQHFKWKVGADEFDNKYCLLRGYALLGKGKYDFSNLKETYNALDCNQEETISAMCIKKTILSGAQCNTKQGKINACLYLKAAAEHNLEQCDQIQNDSELIDVCYFTIAIQLKDPNICKKRILPAYYANNCARLTEQRGELR